MNLKRQHARFIVCIFTISLGACRGPQHSVGHQQLSTKPTQIQRDASMGSEKSLDTPVNIPTPPTCLEAFESTQNALKSGSYFKPFFSWFKGSRNCQGEAINRGLEVAIAESLSNHWNHLKELESFCQDEGFQSYFLSKIGAGSLHAKKTLENVLSLAASGCPAQEPAFCKQLEQTVTRALNRKKR